MREQADVRRRAGRLAETATGAPPVDTRLLAGGHGNTTVAVRTGDGRAVVVRLYERRPEIAAVEHAVLRRAAGAVPVPAVLLADPGGDLTGQPALVQEFVGGMLASAVLAEADAPTAARVGAVLGGALVGLQDIRFPQPGFFGGPRLEPAGMHGGLVEQLAPFLDRTLAAARRHGADARLLGAWRRLVLDTAAAVEPVDGGAVLVHADYNPKNILVERERGHWRVAAVLDWEFAFAGSWLHDLGNLVRFAHHRPPGYAAAVARGARAAGAVLPARWRETAAVLDSFALADFLERGPSTPLYGPVTALVARAVTNGRLSP